MPDVVIHRCTLRIVRRGGWAWGAEPQKLLQSAVKALPELLARELAALWPDEVERQMAAPIRINVPIRLEDLLALGGGIISADEPHISAPMQALSVRIAQAVKATFEQDSSAAANVARVPRAPEQEPPSDASVETEALPGSAIAQLLAAWLKSGVLTMRLAGFSLSALEAWHRHLIGANDELDNAATIDQKTIAKLIDKVVGRVLAAPRARDAILRRRLAALAEAMAQFKLCPGDPLLLAALDQALPLPEAKSADEPPSSTAPGTIALTKARQQALPATNPRLRDASPAPTQTGLPRRRQEPAVERRIASALPFLLLGPLARMGYLQTLAATVEAADCVKDAPLFAAALAYKVLDPPARGWRRSPAVSDAAAAFAALAEPAAEPALVDFARRFVSHLSPLETALAGSLIEGHHAEQPLLLCRAGGGLLLVDVEGVLPIKWAANVSELRAALMQLDSSIFLIPEAVAEAGLLGWMDEEGFRFITDAPPARNERWRALRRPPSERWWTNDALAAESALVRSARALPAATEDVAILWQSLAVERPSVPLLREAALDAHVTLAAAIALGMMAWELWREREPTAPHLALTRFRNLEARVHFTPDVVRVGLPLGRRFDDLRAHGLLDDVAAVPWLAGRRLMFSSG